MAQYQEQFSYDETALIDLKRAISDERLEPYLELAADDLKYAILLYEWNTKLSESLYSILQGFEVTLRNAFHEYLSEECGHQDWYNRLKFQEEQVREIEKAKKRIKIDGRIETPGRVVAELMLGFWTSLAGKKYWKLWETSLHRAFRERRVGRKEVAARFQGIRLLRNRVAHHESIIGRVGNPRPLKKDVGEIIEAASWICITTATWIATNSMFDYHFNRRPEKPSAQLLFPENSN